MTYIQIDDDMHLNRKVRGVSMAARWSYVASICHSGHTLSDGVVLAIDLELVSATTKIAKELVAAGLWEPRDKGWYVHDYLLHNRSREQVEARRIANAANGAKGGAIRRPTAKPTSSKPPSDSLANSPGESLRQRELVVVDPPDPSNLGSSSNGVTATTTGETLSELLDVRFGEAVKTLERGLGRPVTPMEADNLGPYVDKLPDGWIADGIQAMSAQGVRKWSYLRAIWDEWLLNGREEPPRDDPADAHEKRKAEFQRGLDRIEAAKARMAAKP